MTTRERRRRCVSAREDDGRPGAPEHAMMPRGESHLVDISTSPPPRQAHTIINRRAAATPASLRRRDVMPASAFSGLSALLSLFSLKTETPRDAARGHERASFS